MLPHSLEARSLKSRCRRDVLPPGAQGEGPLCLLQLLVAPGAPWLVATSPQPLPLSLHHHTAISVCLRSSSPLFFFFHAYLAALGLSCGPWGMWDRLLQCRFSSCPAAYGILVPRSGIEPVSPALGGRFSTTRPPEKSLSPFL